MSRLTLCNLTALTGLIGIIFLIIIWNGWISTNQYIPRSIEILILVAPQLVFLYGLLHLKYQSHVHITFPALFYFLVGTWYLFSPDEIVYGLLLVVLSLLQFIGGYCYARTIMIRDKEAHHQ